MAGNLLRRKHLTIPTTFQARSAPIDIPRRDPITDTDWWQTITDADTAEALLKPTVGRLMNMMWNTVDLDALADAYRTGQEEEVIAALPLDEWRAHWNMAMRPALYMIMAITIQHERRRLYLRSMPSPKALRRQVQEIAADLADNVVEQAREGIFDLSAMLLGERPLTSVRTGRRKTQRYRQAFAAPRIRVTPEVAAIITRDGIGMNRHQIAGYGRRINENIDEGRDPLDVQEEGVWKTQRQWDSRQLQIARTQAMFAVNESEYMAWNAAYEAGEFDRNNTWLTWIAIGDSKVCDDCLALDGTRRRLNNPYESSGQLTHHPPLHVMCRCVLTIREPSSTYRQRRERELNEAPKGWGSVENWVPDDRPQRPEGVLDERGWLIQEYDEQLNDLMDSLDEFYDLYLEHLDNGDSVAAAQAYSQHQDLGELVDYFKDQRFDFIRSLYEAENPMGSGFNHLDASLDGNEAERLLDFLGSVLPDPGEGLSVLIQKNPEALRKSRAGGAFGPDQDNNPLILMAGDLSSQYYADTFIHEYGHYYDYLIDSHDDARSWIFHHMPQDEDAINAAVNALMNGGVIQDLPTMTGYAGKLYKHGSTELFSTGIENLYRDPVRFQKKAPEHYAYTIWVLEGRPKSADGKRPWED